MNKSFQVAAMIRNLALAFTNAAETFGEMDIATTPVMDAMLMIRDKLHDRGFAINDAETIVSSMDIAVTPPAMTTYRAETEAMADGFADMLVALKAKLDTNNPFQTKTAIEALLAMSGGFSFKLEI